MKAVKLENYRIPARNIAELMWGSGGTISARTNRKKVYYYSCSAHGGYVVDSRVLTNDEKKKIEQHIKPEKLILIVQSRHDGDYVIGQCCQNFQRYGRIRSQSYRYNPSLGPVNQVEYDVYLFEEDCDWSILEYCTDIRLKEKEDNEKWEEIVKDSFQKTIDLKERLSREHQFYR